MQILEQDLRYCNKPSTWQKKHQEEYWRLNPLKEAAQYDSQAQQTTSTNMSLKINEVS